MIHRSKISEKNTGYFNPCRTGGKEVKVHYQGQRGEGVYDVAFKGLVRNVERRYRETGSRDNEKQNMKNLCVSRRVTNVEDSA